MKPAKKKRVVFNKFAALDQTDKLYILRQLKKMFPKVFQQAHI